MLAAHTDAIRLIKDKSASELADIREPSLVGEPESASAPVRAAPPPINGGTQCSASQKLGLGSSRAVVGIESAAIELSACSTAARSEASGERPPPRGTSESSYGGTSKMSYHREASQEEAAFASMMSRASPRETAKPPMMMSQSGKLVSNQL